MLKSALLSMNKVFASALMSAGLDYQMKGNVLSVRLSDGLLKARVKGSSSQIYDIHLDLKTWPSIPSRCTCSYRSNCKHAAASLFELDAKERHGQDPNAAALSQAGWRSDYTIVADEEIFNADEMEWYSEISDDAQDFFSYQLGILVDNKPVSIVPLVVDLIDRIDVESLDQIPDHRLIKLPFSKNKVLQIAMGRLKPLLRLLLRYWLRSH